MGAARSRPLRESAAAVRRFPAREPQTLQPLQRAAEAPPQPAADREVNSSEDDKKEFQKIVDAFHSLHAAVDKRAIPEIGYQKNNVLADIARKRKADDETSKSRTPETVHGRLPPIRAPIDQIVFALRLAHENGEAGIDRAADVLITASQSSAVTLSPEAKEEQLKQARSLILDLAQFLNAPTPVQATGASNQVTPATWYSVLDKERKANHSS